MSVKVNWEINSSFSKALSAVFSRARWICSVLRKAGYSKGMFSLVLFSGHLFN